jgi:N-methylhydantoinase A
MTYAIRNITIERGHDPRQFSLACFGGGGGLFAAHLLDELEGAQAIVPVNPANFSSWGLLNADYREDLTRMFVRPLAETSPDDLRATLDAMLAEARQTLTANGIDGELSANTLADMRYVGQEHTVRVPVLPGDLDEPGFGALAERFNRLHEQAYAHALPEKPVEMVRVRLAATVAESKPEMIPLGGEDSPASAALKAPRFTSFGGNTAPIECPVYDRPKLRAGASIPGPLIVEEWTSTTLVLPGQRMYVDEYGNLLISREKETADVD